MAAIQQQKRKWLYTRKVKGVPCHRTLEVSSPASVAAPHRKTTRTERCAYTLVFASTSRTSRHKQAGMAKATSCKALPRTPVRQLHLT
jgi:hypothetical protein